MRDLYIKDMNQIYASEELISRTITNIKNYNKIKNGSKAKKIVAATAAAITISVGSVGAYISVTGNTEILEKLGIHTNPLLYQRAFTHTSYSNEHNVESYERLEFLGDAVLELAISDYLYQEKHLEEGTMTKMRACYVCEEACATYAKELSFDQEILLGSGESEANTTILADVFESFIGAMYLDQGFSYTSRFVMKIILPYIEKKVNFLHDYKSELHLRHISLYHLLFRQHQIFSVSNLV